MTGPSLSARESRPRYPEPLSTATAVGTRLFAVAVALVVLAFLTNPTPTRDLPGVGLPVTVPLTQPHWGHSAASYLVGMWLWEFTLPLVVLRAARRCGTTERANRALLLGLPVAYMLALYLYCRFHYLPNVTPTPLGPAATGVCWAYCATGDSVWGLATLAVGLLGLGAWLAARADARGSGWLAVSFGVLSLPLGIPALYWGYERISH